MDINSKIARLIEEKGYKTSFVAKKAGIKPDLFSRALQGRRKITAGEFLRICETIGVDANVFKEGA